MTIWAARQARTSSSRAGEPLDLEGRKMVEAARKYNHRAGGHAAPVLSGGAGGRPRRSSRASTARSSGFTAPCSIHDRASDKVTEPQPVPASVDYNLWAGRPQ
jgi:hypothetical protein